MVSSGPLSREHVHHVSKEIFNFILISGSGGNWYHGREWKKYQTSTEMINILSADGHSTLIVACKRFGWSRLYLKRVDDDDDDA